VDEPVARKRTTQPKARQVKGRVSVHRVGRWRFPVFELRQGATVLAQMGRQGWYRIFFGTGQRIELADGSGWRLRATGRAGAICPVVVDEDQLKIVLGSPVVGGYGVIGMTNAYKLYLTEPSCLVRANRWILREHEKQVAVVSRFPLELDATRGIHIGTVLMSFALIQYGIPGENRLRAPKLNWGT